MIIHKFLTKFPKFLPKFIKLIWNLSLFGLGVVLLLLLLLPMVSRYFKALQSFFLGPYWLMLSVADFLSVQLFSTAALYILHRSCDVERSQYRDLWSIILVYQVSAVLSLTFDIVMKFGEFWHCYTKCFLKYVCNSSFHPDFYFPLSPVGSTDSGCSGVFGHTQLFYSIIISIFGLAKFLVPLWTLLCVLQPFEDRSRASEVALATSYNIVRIYLLMFWI